MAQPTDIKRRKSIVPHDNVLYMRWTSIVRPGMS